MILACFRQNHKSTHIYTNQETTLEKIFAHFANLKFVQICEDLWLTIGWSDAVGGGVLFSPAFDKTTNPHTSTQIKKRPFSTPAALCFQN